MEIIYGEVKGGRIPPASELYEVTEPMFRDGCDCAILGCTELSVYRVLHSLPPYYIDAMEILAEQSILRCGKELRNV